MSAARKLSPADVAFIRRCTAEQEGIARLFKVTQGTIWKVKTGLIYKQPSAQRGQQ